MSVVRTTELAEVSGSRKFGEPPVYQRQWVVEVNDPTTSTTDISNGPGVTFLDPHPDANYCRAFNISVANYNGSRWHYLVTWDYEVPKLSQEQLDANPLNRTDIWKFTTTGMAVPALYYYYGSGNNDRRALTNSAGDILEGAMTDISVLQASISGNRQTFDYSTAANVTNCVNDLPYLGGAAYTWKCRGISGQPAVEVVNEIEIRYWQVEVSLEYNPTGWPLLLPNVGWNYVSGGQKKRVWVYYDPGSGQPLEQVAASNPQPLLSNGALDTASPGESNPPMLLTRRVHKAINFQQYFGTPPT
jgi:hypothetical protein